MLRSGNFWAGFIVGIIAIYAWKRFGGGMAMGKSAG